MEILSRLMTLQEQEGAVTDSALREVAQEMGVPLYLLEGLRGFYPSFSATPRPAFHIQVCRDAACALQGGNGQRERLCQALRGRSDVRVEEVSCLGRCDSAPAALVNHVPVSTAGDAVLTLTHAPRGPHPPKAAPAGHPAHPESWPTDPYSGGARAPFSLLRDLIAAPDSEKSRAKVLQELNASGLRGMGGAGFPTGSKWDFTRKAAGDPKYVICNADESEPGTFKDRAILAGLSHLVVEAMAIAGWFIGARQGIVYLRHEYGPEREALDAALTAARAAGALGAKVFGSAFSFDIRVFISPGGYIMGEETALLEALEDRRGEPRLKPPFPTTQGLRGRPTLINNVETFAAVPRILAEGGDAWAALGRSGGKGLKYFSVSGDVTRPGVHCLPLGSPLSELLERCGGVSGGRKLLAFAPGGASSNFLSAAQVEVPLEFAALTAAGSMLGSGAVLVVAEGRDLLEVALSQVRFFRNESCGKCVPCRVGTHKAVALLEQALSGASTPEWPARLPERIRELGQTLARTSICGLGQVALQPLISVLDHFPDQAARLEAPAARQGGTA